MARDRKPQINFQVDPPLKMLYDEAREAGHWVAKFCAAGLLMMVEDPVARRKAIKRLREWQSRYDDASPEQIRAFVDGVQDAMTTAVRDSRPGRKPQPAKKKSKRGGSA